MLHCDCSLTHRDVESEARALKNGLIASLFPSADHVREGQGAAILAALRYRGEHLPRGPSQTRYLIPSESALRAEFIKMPWRGGLRMQKPLTACPPVALLHLWRELLPRWVYLVLAWSSWFPFSTIPSIQCLVTLFSHVPDFSDLSSSVCLVIWTLASVLPKGASR